MENIYYTYAYLRQADDSPYYVGKGKKGRAYDKKHSVVVPKNRNQIVIWDQHLTNEEALELEKFYISFFGRKDRGGILRNQTDGGEGPTGLKRPDLVERNKLGLSEESRKKLSDSHKAFNGSNNPMAGKNHTPETIEKQAAKKRGSNNPNFGKTLSVETRQKMSAARKRAWDRKKGIG